MKFIERMYRFADGNMENTQIRVADHSVEYEGGDTEEEQSKSEEQEIQKENVDCDQ